MGAHPPPGQPGEVDRLAEEAKVWWYPLVGAMALEFTGGRRTGVFERGTGMERVVVIGNSGGGKSVLARQLATKLELPYTDLDTILWLPGWKLVPTAEYQAEHSRLIARGRWLLDGLGLSDSIPSRLARATAVVLIDLPLWIHFWLAAQRQMCWVAGELAEPPAGIQEAPPLRGLFQTMWEVDRDVMPEVRFLVAEEELRGKRIFRITSFEDLDGFLSRPDLREPGGGAVG